MALTALTITEFIDKLASDAPAPGGGSAAALSGALGVSLCAMVAALTAGKAKYAEYEALVAELLAETSRIKKAFLKAIDDDTEAFNKVSAVFAMPKETDEDKQKRKDAMQLALKDATTVPLAVMGLCLEALGAAEKAVGRTNANAASDLGVCALALKAAMQGAWLNVLINVSSIKDENFTAEMRREGESLLKKALPLADQIYDDVLNTL